MIKSRDWSFNEESESNMFLRGRLVFRVLSLLIACGILLLVYSSIFREDEDEFLTQLPVKNDEVEPEKLSGKRLFDIKNIPTYILLNLTQFTYIIPNDMCKQKDLLAILIVTSYAGHDEVRAAHRQAISQRKLAELGFQRVFLLAALPEKEHFITQDQLKDEQKRFGDLLQGNFIENYHNLSYKHVMGLRWAATDCSSAKFIVKLDDDIVYDVFQLRRYLEALEVEKTQLTSSDSFLAGFIHESKSPIRNKANKWYVSREDLPAEVHPAFLSGWFYITNRRTALRLVYQAHHAPFFWIDDLWLTGLLRHSLDIPMQRLNSWFSANSEFIDCCVRDLKKSNFECEYYVGPNGGDSKLLIEFLHDVEKCYFDECVKRTPDKSLKLTCVASVKQILPAHGEAKIQSVKLRR